MGVAYAISLQWDAQERVLLRVWCFTGKRKVCHTISTLQLRPSSSVKTNLNQVEVGNRVVLTCWDSLKQKTGLKRNDMRRSFCPKTTLQVWRGKANHFNFMIVMSRASRVRMMQRFMLSCFVVVLSF